jgi:hypothetical protein
MGPLLFAEPGLAAAPASVAVAVDPDLGPPVGLTIDECVDADRDELRRLLEVEYRGRLADGARNDATQVVVQCTEGSNQVRLSVAGRPREIVRTVDLSSLGPVAREAKTRELVLVIAELVRSVEVPEPVSEPITVPRVPEKAPLLSERSGGTQIGALFTAEKYSGGQSQVGPGLAARFALTRYFTAELRVGARWAESVGAPDGTITGRGFVGGAGVGVDAFPGHARAGLVVMARAEVEWLRIQGIDGETAEGRAASGAAVIASAAPCGWIALGPSLRVLAEPALLVPIHTLLVEDQGQRASALAGVGVAATLGVVAHF